MKSRIRVKLGHVWVPAEKAASLVPGSELLLGAPTDGDAEIIADGRRIACGKLVETDGCYCVEVVEVMRSRLAGPDCGPPPSRAESGNLDRGQ